MSSQSLETDENKSRLDNSTDSTELYVETTVCLPICLPSTDQNHCSQDDSVDVVEQRPYFRNRMMICLLAVAFNWGTSLRIANYFASFVIVTPSLDILFDSCYLAYNLTKGESLRYSRCVESRLGQCNTRLDNTFQKENQRILLISKQNEDLLQRVENVSMSCSKAYTTLRRALEGWTGNGGKIPFRSSKEIGGLEEVVCSIDDQEQFNQTFLNTQNIVALQTEAIQIADTYGKESSLTVERLANYAVERAEYDVNYVDYKTQQLQDTIFNVVDSVKVPSVSLDSPFETLQLSITDVMACISLDFDARMRDGSKCNPSLATMIDEFYQDALWKVSILKQALYEYRDRMEEYKTNVKNAYDVAKRFYNGVNSSVTRWIIDTFFSGDWFDVSLSDMTPVDVNFPDVQKIIDGIGQFQRIDIMWETVLPKINTFHFNILSVREVIKERFEDLIKRIQMAYSVSVRLALLLIPDDYKPPQYVGANELRTSPEDEVNWFQDKRNLFVTQIQDALNMFSVTRSRFNQSGLELNTQSYNITEIKNKVTNVELNFESLLQPDIDFKFWFLQFSFLTDGFVYLDYIYRVYVSITLIFKYWFATSLTMPMVDLRVNKEIFNPFRMHPARAFLVFITSPFGMFMIVVISSVWLIATIASLYIPLLQSYISGCIDSNENGTFVTKNLFSISYNYAYHEGSALLIEGMKSFDKRRGDMCTSRFSTSATLHNSMVSNLTAYGSFHQEFSDNMGLAQRCIEGEKLTSLFLGSCCGFPTYPVCSTDTPLIDIECPIDDLREIMSIQMPFELPGIMLGEPSCSVSLNSSEWEIKDIIFDCENLASCNVTCKVPHRDMLSSACEKCGCTLEWYLHSKTLEMSLAILFFLLMNAARVFLISGVTRLLWKYIYPERFTVLATCDANGKLVTTPNVSEILMDDKHKRQSRSTLRMDDTEKNLFHVARAELSIKLRHFYVVGIVLLVLFFITSGVWIFLVIATSQTLTPRVWR